MKNDIVKIADKTGVEIEKAKRIWSEFEPYFSNISACAEKVSDLEITDVSQKEEISLARRTRIELKNLRVAAEKTKKALKAGILKEGRFIEATFELIASTTKPLEDDLKEKEEFAKRKEAERIEKLVHEREIKLKTFGVNTRHYDLAKMSDEQFEDLFESSRFAHEKRLEAERKAKEEQLAREKAEAAERARIEAENARLRAAAEELERQLAEQRAKIDAERRAREAADRREREAKEAAEQAERKKQEEELRKVREAQEAAERELRAKQEAEERARQEEAAHIEALRKAEEEEKRRLEAASDKEKLSAYFDKVTAIEIPTVKSESAAGVIALLNSCIRACLSKIESFSATTKGGEQ